MCHDDLLCINPQASANPKFLTLRKPYHHGVRLFGSDEMHVLRSRALQGWSVFSRAHKCMGNRLSAPLSSGGWDRTSLVTGQLCNGCILVGPPDGSLSSPLSFPQAIFQSASPTLSGFTVIHLNTAAASL